MSVSRAANGTYEFQLWVKDSEGKRRKVHRRGFKKKSDAQQAERLAKLKYEGSPSMTFRDFVAIYEEDVRPQHKANTWVTKMNIIRSKLIPAFGDRRLDEITPTDIIRWQAGLKSAINPNTDAGYTSSYIRTIENQMSAVLNHAVRYYGLRSNPMKQTRKVGTKNPAHEMDFWTPGEFSRFSDAIADKPDSHLAFDVLFYTGIREGELLALTPGDFDFNKGLLRITRSYQRIGGEDVVTSPKTPKSVRTIALPDFLTEEVAEHARLYFIAEDERLFPHTKSWLYREMERGCKASGVKRIRVHDLRHSHVSLLIEMGFSALAIADRLGHEAVDITYRYAHLFPSVQGDMAARLNDMWKGGDDK